MGIVSTRGVAPVVGPKPRRARVVDQNVLVYCPACGSQIDGLPCAVCGAQSPVPRAGRPPSMYAGWWLRVAATVLDNLVLTVPLLGAYLLGDALVDAAVGTLASILVQAAYLIGLLARPSGQTIGNLLVGTRVRDAATGQPITSGQAVRRWVLFGCYNAVEFAGAGNSAATLILGAVVLGDILYPLMNEQKQTWHDRLAGTIVIKGLA